MGHKVRYHNDLASVPLQDLTAIELNLFFAIFRRCMDRGTDTVIINFKTLRKEARYKDKHNDRLAKCLWNMYKKVMRMTINIGSTGHAEDEEKFFLYEDFDVYEESQELHVAIQEEFAYLLNDLDSNYTSMDFDVFVELDSKFSKNCYRQLMRYRDTGIWAVSLDAFLWLMCVPESYGMADINKRVLRVINRDLERVIAEFHVEKVYGDEWGHKVKRLVFTFTPEERECVECQP